MKKWLWCFFPVIIVLAMTAAAMAELDYDSMSDAEIVNVINSATDELSNRHLGEEHFVLRDGNGILIYATGKLSIDTYTRGKSVIKLEVVIDNSTDKTLIQSLAYQTVNGWDAYGGYAYSCAPHSKKITAIDFSISNNPEINALEDVSVLTIKFERGIGVTLVVQDGKVITSIENNY